MSKTFEKELEEFLEKYRDTLTLQDQEPRQHSNNCTFLSFAEGYRMGKNAAQRDMLDEITKMIRIRGGIYSEDIEQELKQKYGSEGEGE